MRCFCRLIVSFSLILTALGQVAAEGPRSDRALLLKYNFAAGETMRYKLVADVRGSLPILDNPKPSDIEAVITVIYLATPKIHLADGTSDVAFTVESAELEVGAKGVAKFPIPLDTEQIEKVLNQSVTFASTGEVKRVIGGGPVPFSLSIPGVDPKRLYVLLFPVVFQNQPVNPGQTWQFKSELLGAEKSPSTFSATLQPEAKGASAGAGVRITQKFNMDVDQSLDAEKKPLADGAEPYRTRKGRISGSGDMRFDSMMGRFTQSQTTIQANITERLFGPPTKPDEPKEIVTKVTARVTVVLQTDRPAPPTGGGNGPVAKEIR